MAKSKYDKDTFPILAEGWAREGLNDEQIAKNLGISKDTFYRYVKKHSDFSDAIKKGKGPVDFEVENALLKKAMGFTVQVKKTFKVKHIKYDKATGKKISEKEKLVTGYDDMYIPPEAVSIFFWLKNRKSDKWRDRIPEGGANPNDMGDILKEFGDMIIKGDLDG